MENLTQEALRATMRTTYEKAMGLASPERLEAFTEELTQEEKNRYYTTIIHYLSNRLDETEKRADFAAITITLAALTAVGYIGTKNIKTSLNKKKDQRRTETDSLITKYFEKEITREDLKASVNKKDKKYVNEMTNEKIFE